MRKLDSNLNGLRFIPDGPAKKSEDALNRKRFAKVLANRILEFNDSECLIVGIHGRWGSGKTTFLGYLESEMSDKVDDVIIVHFNPWNFSTIDQLIMMFFDEIKSAVRKGKGLRDIASEIGKRLDNLSKILAPFEAVGGLIALPYSFMIPSGVSSTIEKTGITLKQFADQDPADLKKELNALLEKYDKKIIIFIDDLDRLDKCSMSLIFRLIRLNADFINTIYILSFDRDVVENALSEEQSDNSGRKYLEKFIQVPFDLPLPEHTKIIEILMKHVIALLPPGSRDEFNSYSYRWTKLRNEFYSFFRTLRDVKRYTNGLLLTLPTINEEINYLDFISLEAIRIFEPDIYASIAENKELLLGNAGHNEWYLNKDELELRKKHTNDIIKPANTSNSESIKRIISDLFPHAGENKNEGYRKTYRKEKRICSSYRFDNYFLFALPEGEITQSEMDKALEAMNNKESFETIMMEYKEKDLIVRFLDRIIDYVGQVPMEKAKIFVCTFFDKGDKFIKMSNETLDYDLEIRICQAVLSFIEWINESSERAELITNCLEHSVGFYIPLSVIFDIKKRLDRHDDIITEEAFQKISRSINSKVLLEVPKIHEKLESRQKAYGITVSKLSSILVRWKGVSGIEGPKDFVTQLIRDDYGLIKLLTAFLTATDSGFGLNYSFEDHSFVYISEFIDTSSILPRIKSIRANKDELIKDYRERIAIDEFIRLAEKQS